eukprot:84069_1
MPYCIKFKKQILLLFVIFLSISIINLLQFNTQTVASSNLLFPSEKINPFRFQDKSIAIIGLAYNSELTISHLLDELHILSCSFKHVVYIFYESNSMDNTPLILKQWQNNHTNYKC